MAPGPPALGLVDQFRQLGDIRRNPSRLVAIDLDQSSTDFS
jgi:hypothetical protein